MTTPNGLHARLTAMANAFALRVIEAALRQLGSEDGTSHPRGSAPGRATIDELATHLMTVPVDGPRDAAIQRALLSRAIELAGGNRSAAARLLGVPRKVFLRREARFLAGPRSAAGAGSRAPRVRAGTDS